jgi:uncharacterized protein with PQ loop repeat
MYNIIGWAGSIILGVSSIPQMKKVILDGHADGMAGSFLFCWTFGEILSLIYVAPSYNWPLIANYSINLVILLIIGYYKLFPRFSRKPKLNPTHFLALLNKPLRPGETPAGRMQEIEDSFCDD